MAIRTYKVTLDSKNSIAPEPVLLRQGDKTGAVVIDATLMDNGSPVSLRGLTPMFKANTADGKALIADSTGFNIVNASGGEFTYQVPNALSAVPGKIVTAYFSFSDKSGIQSTFDVAFIIKKAVGLTQDKAEDYIATIGAIGIKGAYNNLQALISAKPDGDIGIYVTTDTGHWFFWNGTAWQDGGQFQAAGIDQTIIDQIKNIADNLNQLPELIDSKPTPSHDTVISKTNYLNQDWFKMTSTANTPYRGLSLFINKPDKIFEMATYPVKIHFNIQSSIDQNLILDAQFYDENGQDLHRSYTIDNIELKAYKFINYQKEFSFDPSRIKGARKVALFLYTIGTNDLGTVLFNNYSAVLEYNTNEKVNRLPELIEYQSPSHDTVISTINYLGQDWLKMTSTANTTYRGLKLWINNPDKSSAMANYPVKIHFNIQSSIDQNLILDAQFYDDKGQDLNRSYAIDNIELQASKILNYQKEFLFDSSRIKGARKVALFLYTIGTNDLGTVMINDYSAVLEYNTNEMFNRLPELIDSQPTPISDTVISTINYLDQNWLKMTSTANTTYRGLKLFINKPDKIFEMATYPVKIHFNIQSSIDQNLILDAQFYDENGQDLHRSFTIDNIGLKSYEFLNYQKEFSFDPSRIKGARKVALFLYTIGTNDLGTVLFNNYSAVLEYNTNEMIDKLEGYYNLPIIKINGELDGINKDNAKQVTYEYRNGDTVLTGFAKLKWQGNSTLLWDKKGYRLQPFTDNTFAEKEKVQFIPSWSPTSKINLKAYYTDGLLSRDVVNANIGADIASTNLSLPNDLKQEDNFGFIDGFPIVLLFNNEFEGIYSFNTARSDFGYVKYGIMGNGYTNVTDFTSANKADVKLDGSDFESLNPETVTDDEKSAVGDLVTWVATSSDENFKADFEKHLDLKTTIDYFIMCNLLASTDSFAKNQIFLSWDGVKWFMQAYDFDCTLGIDWKGNAQDLPTELIGIQNNLFKRLAHLFNSEISSRYTELRSWLTPAYMLDKYKKRVNEIGVGNYKLEFAKWNNPSKDVATYKQLKDAVLHQFNLLDSLWLK